MKSLTVISETFAEDGSLKRVDLEDSKGRRVGSVSIRPWMTPAEIMAYAHAWAAAAETLQALQALEGFVTESGVNGASQYLAKARAAIQKAGGAR
jgi:hypothetical protein